MSSPSSIDRTRPSGGSRGILWDVPEDTEIASLIEALLQAGEAIVENTGPWDRARLPAPPEGTARVNVLTFGGLHFGQDDYGELTRHPLGGPAINAAYALMLALMAKHKALPVGEDTGQ